MNASDDNGFDDLLERKLGLAAAGYQGPTVDPAQSVYHAAFLKGGTAMFSSLTTAAATKAVVGIAAATLVVGGAATLATGSPNPSVWGTTVTRAVTTCKADLQSGTHGIGVCVSDIAKQKGEAERTKHQASGAPSGAPASHSTSQPTDVPVGPPANLPAAGPGGRSTGASVTPQ